MPLVQASLAFSIEFLTFHNVDLFEKGYYHVRSYIKPSSKVPCKVGRPELVTSLDTTSQQEFQLATVKDTVPSDNSSSSSSTNEIVSKAITKTIHLIYRNEKIDLNDVFKHHVYLQSDCNNLEETISSADLVLCVELWFFDGDRNPRDIDNMTCVNSREYKLSFSPSRGLHYYFTIFFDYFHLCSVETIIHGSLVDVSPCYLNISRVLKPNEPDNNYRSWQSILFNSRDHIGRRHLAQLIHKRICMVLLSSYESLHNTMREYIELNPSDFEHVNMESSDCYSRLASLVEILQGHMSEEDIANQVSKDVSKLCSELLALMNFFLNQCTLKNQIVDYLARKTHQQRMKRFAEAFFTQENSIAHLLAVYDPKTTGHDDVASLVRNSEYFQGILSLPVECTDLDGSPQLLPIIFEDVYVPENIVENNASCNERSTNRREYHRSNSTVSKISVSSLLIRNDNRIPLLRPLANVNNVDMPLTDSDSGVSMLGFRKIADDSELTNSTNISESDCLTRSTDNITGNTPQSNKRTPIALGTLRGSLDGHNLTHDKNGVRLERQRALTLGQSMPNLRRFSIKSTNGLYEKRNSYTPESETMKRCRRGGRNRERSMLTEGITLEEFFRETCSSDDEDDNEEEVVTTDKTNNDSTADTENVSNNHNSLIPTIIRSYPPASDSPTRASSNASPQPPVSSTPRRNLSYEGNLLLASSSPHLNSSLSSGSFSPTHNLVHTVADATLKFVQHREELKRQMFPFQGHVYSERPYLAAEWPYFRHSWLEDEEDSYSLGDRSVHLVVCVHGLDGNSLDLRLVRVYLQLALPESRLDFLMSESNQNDTFAEFDVLRRNLVNEILQRTNSFGPELDKISFIGHSMGCLLIRAALTSPQLNHLHRYFHTFLSLSGPHLGTVYNSSNLVRLGMWFVQRWKKSTSLLQMSMKDDADLRETYLYKLADQPGFELFRYVLLVSSQQDKYVPYHSTRIELCRAAVKDNQTLGNVYMEMVTKILQRIVRSSRTTVMRYDVYHSLPRSKNTMIGRAAHIAVLDSEIFLEKFICVSAAKYFK